MTNFIEEFYYGNIDPQARSFEQNKKVQRDMQMLNESEDFLTNKLSGEEKKRFLQYVDAWASVNGESTLDSFITGFRRHNRARPGVISGAGLFCLFGFLRRFPL